MYAILWPLILPADQNMDVVLEQASVLDYEKEATCENGKANRETRKKMVP